MTSIRWRLFLLFTLFAGSTLFLACVSYQNFVNLHDARQQLDLSYSIRDKLLEPIGKPDAEIALQLQSYGAKLQPARRAEEIRQVLHALSEGNRHVFKERQAVFLKNEAEFSRVTREQLDFLEKRLLYYGSISLVILAFGFTLLQLFLNRMVIRPISDLSRKMVDFLHDRYTYQFSVPTSDEIGHMHSTFNSLAQRVIANMAELKTLDQAKSEFLSIASHELRTPLTSIKGSLSLLRTGVVGKMNDMAENLLNIAETETDRLIRLINDILDLAKIEARKLPLHQEWVSWNDLVKVSVQSISGLSTQAQVHLNADEIPPLETYIDRDRMQQVLTNLLSNAIKFSPQNGDVVIHCAINDKNELIVEVCDNGRGIAPEDQDAIFQKFRQASNSRHPLVKGTGLGLAIARALVEQHGGEIGVRSIPGAGATFYFSRPEWRYGHAKGAEVAA